MRVLVIDGQGGGIGKQLVAALLSEVPEARITAVGTNTTATAAMLKAGAHQAATGENAVVVNSRTADLIIGPVGMVVADSLLGEITADMAAAVARSAAQRVLIPVNLCGNIVVGVKDQSIAEMLREVVALVRERA